ncbi:MAG TPA: hypothetical protein EYO33_11205 [Phycisphaerales bacterium]|nr:hypothetical protein [Phycisphaerales bacterium]
MACQDLEERLFGGELIRLVKSPQTAELVQQAWKVVRHEFGEMPLKLSPDEFRGALTQARSKIQAAPFPRLVESVLEAAGLCLKGLRLDSLRLRAVTPGLEHVEAAAPVFYCHRDTWYGNPSCQINGWIPLHAVDGRNSFRFFTDYFERPINNDSHLFSAAKFAGEGGFGRVPGQVESVYPRALDEPRGEYRDICCEEGELLLFAAAHLHQTLPNRTDSPRFSLDFRFYRDEHLQSGRGAPDPDNRSCGLLTNGYRPL